MTKVYMVDVSGRMDDRGVGTFSLTGEVLVIDGVEHVRYGNGVILPRRREWCETLAEAKALAAGEIEEMAGRLLRQAKAMREGVTDGNG